MSYAAFISYKHGRSSKFAARLEQALKVYAKPLLKPPLKIFRDEKHLRPGSNLPEMIRSALEKSQFLILLASPDAAQSSWVKDELEIWLTKLAREAQLIIVLTAGQIEVNGETKKIDWDNTDALPLYLRNHLDQLPFYLDGRDFISEDGQVVENPQFKLLVNSISAALRGLDPNDLIGEEVIQYKKNVRLKNAAIYVLAGLFCVAIISLGWALYTKDREQAQLYKASLIAAKQNYYHGSPPDALRLLSQVPTSKRDGLWNLIYRSMKQEHSTLRGHSWWVFNLAYDPAKKTAISVGADNTVRVWTLPDGTQLKVIEPDIGRIEQVLKSPTSRFVYLIGENGISLFDNDSWGQVGKALNSSCFKQTIKNLIRPDGLQLIGLGDDKICLIDLIEGQLKDRNVRRFDIKNIAYTRDGKEIAVLRPDLRQVEFRKSSDFQLVKTLILPEKMIVDFGASDLQNGLLVGHYRSSVKYWNSNEPQKMIQYNDNNDNAEKEIRAVGFAQKDGLIWAITEENEVIVWNQKTGKKVVDMDSGSGYLSYCETTLSGRHLACIEEQNNESSAPPAIRLWRLIPPFYNIHLRGHTEGINAIEFVDDNWLLSASHDMTVKVWPLHDQLGAVRISFFDNEWDLTAAKFLNDGTDLIATSKTGDIAFWSSTDGKVQKKNIGVRDLEILDSSLDENLIALSGEKDTQLLDLQTGKILALSSEFHAYSGAFRPHRGHFAIGGAGLVQLMNISDRTILWTTQIGENGRMVRTLQFSKLGDRILVAADDGYARLLSAENGRELAKFDVVPPLGRVEQPVFFATFNAAEDKILVGTALNGASIFNTESGELVSKFTGHGPYMWVSGGTFINDETVVTVGADKSVRGWDVETGIEIAEYRLSPRGEVGESPPKLFVGTSGSVFAVTHLGHIEIFSMR